MPALPFFSALAPAPMASQGPTPQGNPQSTSPLSEPSATAQTLDESAMGSTLDSEQEPSFLQQFQVATQGQEIAASLPAFSKMDQAELDVETELNSDVLLQAPIQESSPEANPIMAPWAVNQPEPIEGDLVETVSPQIVSTAKKVPVIEMSDLEKQRQAMPTYQVNEGESIQPQALQAREMNLQHSSVMQEADESAAPLMAMNQTASNKTLQSGLNQPLAETVSDPEVTEGPSLKLGLTSFESESKEIDSELLDENIHEKPITLQPRETILKPVVSAPMETLAMQQPDSLEGVQGPQAAQTTKSSALTENLQGKQAEASTEKTTAQFKVDVPPQNPQWNDQVAKRIGIMASEQLQTARIQLDPPELGALEVKIKVQHDQVSVAFASNHPSVRDALESQAPRLRELLEQQGVELADVSVSDQQQGQSHEQAGGTDDGFSGEGDSWQDDTSGESMTQIESDSLVDYFA